MFRLKMIWIRIRALFQRDQLEIDMDKEFEFHLEMRIAENIAAGMSAEQARSAAMRRFGSVGLAKERGRDVRGPGFLQPLLQDARYGVRTLRHNPGFTVVAVFALALGLGANTAVFRFADAIFLRPLPLPDPDRLVRFYGQTDDRSMDSFSYPDYLDVRNRNRSFTGLAVHQITPVSLTTGEEPERVQAELVSGNYFHVLGVRPLLGRVFVSEDDTAEGANPIVVISSNLWRTRFGSDARIVGREASLNGRSFTIVGVAPESFKGTFDAFATQIWAPIVMHEQIRPTGLSIFRRGWGWLHGTGRLKPEVTIDQAKDDINAVGRRIKTELGLTNDLRFDLTPAGAMPGEFRSGASRVLWFFTFAASAVLLITCGNIASVLLARAMARRKEIAIRQSLGASRSRLLRQWLTESVLLAVIGGGVGLIFAVWLTNAVIAFAPSDFSAFSPEFRLDMRVLGFAFALAVFAGVIFGFFPAWWVRKANVVSATRSSRSRFHRALVTLQVALSLVLLIVAGLLFRSVRESEAFDPGFQTDNLLVASADLRTIGYSPSRQAPFYFDLMERVKSLPGVTAATASLVVPLGPHRESVGVLIPGHEPLPGKKYFSINNNVVGPDYFSTMGIPIVRGRAFNAGEFRPDSRPVAIVGETMARQFWANEDAVGQTIRFSPQGPDVEIVGIARDIKYYSLRESPMPYLYRPYVQANLGGMTIVVRTSGDAGKLINPLKSEVKAIDPNVSLQLAMTFADLRSESLLQPRAMLVISGFFGVIAIVLTGVGLYGVISYSVNRRTAEIGIRMAIGAGRRDILRMVITDGVRITAIGVFAGLLIAFGVTRFISSQLFGVTATDPLTFVAIALMIFVVAVAACYLPARRATRIPPTLALKCD